MPRMHYSEGNQSLDGELGELSPIVSRPFTAPLVCVETHYWFPELPGPGVRGEKEGEVGE